MKEFKIGDKVKIRKDSPFYNKLFNGDKDSEGKIIMNHKESREHFIYRVRWTNKQENNYRFIDLELYDDEVKSETKQSLDYKDGYYTLEEVESAIKEVLMEDEVKDILEMLKNKQLKTIKNV